MPKWEVFDKRAVRSRRPGTVTIQKGGLLSLNAPAYEAMGSPKAVELLYDADERMIGVREVDVDAEHGFVVRPGSKRAPTSFTVTATAFMKHYGIDTSAARRWPAVIDGDTLCIDLNSPATPVTRSPPRAGVVRRRVHVDAG